MAQDGNISVVTKGLAVLKTGDAVTRGKHVIVDGSGRGINIDLTDPGTYRVVGTWRESKGAANAYAAIDVNIFTVIVPELAE